MRLWKILGEQQFADAAPACFGRELMMSDFMGHGLIEEDGAWIASGMSESKGIPLRSTDQEAGLSRVIPKGTVVLGNTWAIHYDPSRYPDPTTFNPERYLAHNKYAAEYAAMGDPLQRDHYAFGAGRRICSGARLAENTPNLALANLVWCFRIEPPSNEAQMDLSNEAWEDTTFRPPKPFKARLVPRGEERVRVGDQTWMKAREQGYTLRGVWINEKGVEIR
ncbi:hypothetical protein LTR37_003150 [Vermiconidia calcicola]|uniref:Uncharacterized protein n=1 Tax=Vermiconidia calcicola TaxID=1690605 RepID=A0ACC3NRB1_9PEZI|nr:hypothetical protein LTR37_003150 [Vermiconidia calcicola]